MPVSTPNGYLDFTNATPRATKVIATSNVGVGFNNPLHALDVAGTANVGVLTATSVDVSGNLYSPNMPLATIASNLITYDSSTGLIQDSGGLFSNKLAVVSEQPPSALSGASTTVSNHGTYKLTASTGTPQGAFDKVTSTTWTASSNYGGGSGTGVYVGAVRLATGLEQGDWIAVEFPYKATLRHLTLTAGDGASTSLPEKANLYATNDNITWSELKNWQAGETTVLVNASEPYKKYAIVTTKTVGNATLKIGQLKFFCESFSVDGGKIEMATSALTGGASVMEQTTAHARDVSVLKRYPELKMGGLDNQTKAGVTVSSSSTAFNETGFFNSNVYNQIINNEGWHMSSVPSSVTGPAYTIGGVTGEWHKTEFPNKLKVASFHIAARYGFETTQAPKDLSILGSNDDSTWVLLKSVTGLSYNYFQYTPVQVNASDYYKYLAVVVTDTIDGIQAGTIGEMYWMAQEYVGEGDTSLDTTIVSKYNTSDLTNASLYLDGLKGSTATDYSGRSITVTENNVTWDSTEKSWTLSGAATSNVVSADLGLAGDQPHTVSAWVKADQLNGRGLFHLGTAEGEGDAASRVGFVDDSHISWGGENHYFSNAEWHNVTYTYNGEGSDKKLYLDGRLVGSAKNEDTFGEYPQFNMNEYSQYGYTVSASSDYTTDSSNIRRAWGAYHSTVSYTTSTTAGVWMTNFGTYSSTSPYGAIGGDTFTDTNGGTHTGHWNKIKLPYKLNPSYVYFTNSGTFSGSRMASSWVVLGSNDDNTWDLLVSSLTVLNAATTSVPMNSTKGYMYLMFLCKNINGDSALVVEQIRYYGHRENDLVRFPDPTNVLKYPHMDLHPTSSYENYTDGSASHAERGYVATSSTGDAGRLFNGTTSYFLSFGSNNGPTTTYTGNANHTLSGFARTGYTNEVTTEVGGATHIGTWVDLETPRKLKLSQFKVCFGSGDSYAPHSPTNYRLLGRNATTDNWNLLFTIDGSYPNGTVAPSTGGTDKALHTIATSDQAFYKYHRWVCTRLHSTNSAGTGAVDGGTIARPLIFYGVEYYGTEEDLDVVARIGDGYDGKVRNLRVYSTALSEARVQEIFDADKDEFVLAKSSVSVYRGHLGIGTTEPKAALTVMDEVGELEEFPPRAMIGKYTGVDLRPVPTYIEGHGVFTASASSQTYVYPPNLAFNKNYGYGTSYSASNYTDVWASLNGDYKTSDGYAESSNAAVLNGVTGAWLKLEMPYKVKPQIVYIYPRGGYTTTIGYQGTPRKGRFLGSNDNETWEVIQTFNDLTFEGLPPDYDGNPQGAIPAKVTLNASSYYKYITLQVERIYVPNGASGTFFYTTVQELRYFGTREQGASTLHNGELTLTRNLTVPRIGPALDADDTPRRDRLVVEYNTSTNPTENGVVKDTSGRGLDGLTYNGAHYDASEKALVFDGTDDYVFQNDVHLKTGVGGVYSASVWVKNRASSGTQTVYSLGTYSQLKTSTLYVLDTTLQVVFYNSDLSVTYTVPKNTWTHIIVTHAGGPTSTTTKMYINGVDVGLAAMSGTAYPLSTVDFPSPCNLFLGKNSTGSVYGGPMDISNFKLYDVVLTADEVKRLYDMGRCDEGHHVVNFSKTRVGIGLGDGEAPRADLDVRGGARFDGSSLIIEPCIRGFYEQGTWTPIIYGTTGGEKTPTNANGGWFVRIGNMVTVGGTLSWNGGTTISGQVRIKTLPYTIPTGTNNRAALSFGVADGSAFTTPTGAVLRMVVDPGSDFIYLIASYESGASSYDHVFTVGASGNLYGFGGSYLI